MSQLTSAPNTRRARRDIANNFPRPTSVYTWGSPVFLFPSPLFQPWSPRTLRFGEAPGSIPVACAPIFPASHGVYLLVTPESGVLTRSHKIRVLAADIQNFGKFLISGAFSKHSTCDSDDFWGRFRWDFSTPVILRRTRLMSDDGSVRCRNSETGLLTFFVSKTTVESMATEKGNCHKRSYNGYIP